MQNKVISKIYNFTIDTKKITKPLFVRDKFDMSTSDSVIWNITIQEDGVAKDISDCSVRLLVNKPNGTIPCEQKDNIVITGTNVISIQPKDTMTNVEGRNTYTLVISDVDEEIVCQPFIFNIFKSSVTDIVESATNELSTLEELTSLIGQSYSDLQFIREKAKELGVEVDEEIQTINQDLANVDREIDLLENKIIDTNNKFNKLPSRIVLTPVSVGSYYYFETPVLTSEALKLLDNQFTIYLKGRVSNDDVIRSAFASCVFVAKPNAYNVLEVYPFVNIHNNPIINSKSLQIEIVFGDNSSTSIIGTTKGYKLRVKTNLLKSYNYVSEISCVFSNMGVENLI